ncbi:MAG: DUF1592 domain-containing protein [Gemmatimonadetes bacterium]|nr:DUF1592 domain-containing protein [Gemmatimonadota bacterium]
MAGFVTPGPRPLARSPRVVDAATPARTARDAAAARVEPHAIRHARRLTNDALTSVVRETCADDCHSDEKRKGQLSLEAFDVRAAAQHPEVSEKIISKLRAGMMPPVGENRPAGDTLLQLASRIESIVDRAAALAPEPGTRTFQRLNRAEYESSIRDVLALDVDASSWLPLDTKSANFDNIADVQLPSATMLEGYLDAASSVSRLAVGDPNSGRTSHSYKVPRLASQLEHVDGAPFGTRGGVSVIHTFPADGEYVFTVMLHAIPTGQLFGSAAPFDEKIEISVNGERVALIAIDRWMSQADPTGMDLKTAPVPVRAGPQRISAAFVKTFDGPVNDNIAPIGHSLADTQIGSQDAVTALPHLRELTITGPFDATGLSDTPSRRRIFTCRPMSADEARPCAARILTRLGAAAYRRPLSGPDVSALLAFYDKGTKDGGFEEGVRWAIEAMLASPHFIFRIEELPPHAKPGERYAVRDVDLASRLSFFLWGEPPDAALLAVARSGRLSTPEGLRAEARRMLADPRSEALSTRFAAQWLRLQDLDKVHPDALQFPDFSEQLASDMRRETELFFQNLVRENRSALELLSADYTFVNEPLARHYGIAGVTGEDFRRVRFADDRRGGLLGQASILTLTSHANRTSPVLRGKWVMEVLLGSPPPPPPPNVPDLEKTGEAKDGRLLTTRERMEMHRENPNCRSCHRVIDPIGLALDNFDVTGHWRIRENGAALDTHGQLYDGTPVSTLPELRAALLRMPTPLLRTFTQNLMAYALGRRVEYYDQPAIRRIVAAAEPGGYRMQDLVLGVVASDAFRMRRVPPAATPTDAGVKSAPGAR